MQTPVQSSPTQARPARLGLGRQSARRGGRVVSAGAVALATSFLPGLIGSVGAGTPATSIQSAVPQARTQTQLVAAAMSNSPIVGLAAAGTGGKYWMVSSTGTMYAFGGAPLYGSLAGVALTKPIVGIAATPTGHGYWLVASDGGVFAFGDAQFHGSTGGVALTQPIVTMAATKDGGGYWLVASDGGVFAFGDAQFHGSTGGVRLTQPIVGMSPTPSGRGYWLVASDGGVFAFGDAQFHGSTGGVRLTQPIVGMAATATGTGYWLVASDGGVFSFGSAPYKGSAVNQDGGTGANAVGILPIGQGYWVPNDRGQVANLGGPDIASTQPVVDPANPPPSRLPASVNPAGSIAPSNTMAQACFVTNPNIAACDAASLNDINAARAREGYGPLPLPANYEALSFGSQLLVVADAERTTRGLPAFAENASLDRMAQAGAVAGNDPTGPNGFAWGSNIAWGDPTPLAADFGWMYDDGTNSENIDCRSASDSGCWGHRENILANWSGAAGVGVYNNRGTLQLTQLFVDQY